MSVSVVTSASAWPSEVSAHTHAVFSNGRYLTAVPSHSATTVQQLSPPTQQPLLNSCPLPLSNHCSTAVPSHSAATAQQLSPPTQQPLLNSCPLPLSSHCSTAVPSHSAATAQQLSPPTQQPLLKSCSQPSHPLTRCKTDVDVQTIGSSYTQLTNCVENCVIGGHVHASKLYSSIFQGVSWAMFRFMSHFLAAARKHWLVVSWRWWALGSSFDEIRLDLKKTTNCWLSVTASSLTHFFPISLTSQCTCLPGSFVLLQAHWYFESFMLEQTPLANTVSPTVLQSNRICSLMTSITVFPCLQNCVKNSPLNNTNTKQYHNNSKFHLFTCLPPPRYPPSLLTFLLCACVYVRACVKTILRLYHSCWCCKAQCAHPCRPHIVP